MYEFDPIQLADSVAFRIRLRDVDCVDLSNLRAILVQVPGGVTLIRTDLNNDNVGVRAFFADQIYKDMPTLALRRHVFRGKRNRALNRARIRPDSKPASTHLHSSSKGTDTLRNQSALAALHRVHASNFQFQRKTSARLRDRPPRVNPERLPCTALPHLPLGVGPWSFAVPDALYAFLCNGD